jgi:ATP-dependent exoDNAse (exonuclease V) beta subunit
VIGDAELGVGGMVDGLFWNQKHGELQIWDYKTNKEIAEYSKYKKRMKIPINFLHDCELEGYSIQLNLYKYIIERNTNLKIGKCYLVHIHEEQEKYNVIECKEYQHIIQLLFDYKTKQK